MGDAKESIDAMLKRARESFEKGFVTRRPVCDSCTGSALAPPNARPREVGEVCVACGGASLPSVSMPSTRLNPARDQRGETTTIIPRLVARGIPYKDIERLVERGGELTETRPLTVTRGWYADLAAEQPKHERMRPKHPPYFLLLAGGVGIGKTTACSWFIAQPPVWRGNVAEGMRRAGAAPRYIAVSDMQCAELNNWRDKAEITLWKTSLSLAIDDLGAEAESQRQGFADVLNAVLEHRYRDLMPTLLTTNLTAQDLGARYGVRFYERLKESAGTVCNFDETSMRGQP